VTCMLLARRFFRDALSQPGSLHLTCDSSPITGMDIFGAYIDVFYHDGFRTFTLPGATLAHGYTTALHKALTLVWSLWLIAGPSMQQLETLLARVRSMTTDWGVESFIPSCGNPLQEFAQTMGLRVSEGFRALPNMFAYCVHIGDWNHTIATIVKRSFESVAAWADVLEKLRALVKFFKNSESRNVCMFNLRKLKLTELLPLFKSFGATFVRWRYETICQAICDVLSLQDFCVSHLKADFFKRQQQEGAKLLGEVLVACKDRAFWCWLHTMAPLARTLEKTRRWGNGCACHEEDFQKGRTVACCWTSRRLGEAREYVAKQVAKLRGLEGALVLSDCGDVHENFVGMKYLYSRAIAEFQLRFKWWGEAPYLFANACQA
jgi:hypothetical protein